MIEARASKAPGWTTKASRQVALILATFDAQELVPEKLKVSARLFARQGGKGGGNRIAIPFAERDRDRPAKPVDSIFE